MPAGHIFVSNTGGNIKHDNGTLTLTHTEQKLQLDNIVVSSELTNLNVVAISQSAKFLLTSSVPYIEPDCSSVSVENQWMDFNTKSGNIFLLKFTCQMAFDEGCLASATVTDKNKFESGHISIRSHISNFLQKKKIKKMKNYHQPNQVYPQATRTNSQILVYHCFTLKSKRNIFSNWVGFECSRIAPRHTTQEIETNGRSAFEAKS